ncbi:hypothetical protein ACFQOZ_07955 [Comamonas endophytica]|uniref:hypothetical protein n=1 Tax=Comamonas endophytica TaxID=2949090 RepID=UPI0036120855
MLGHRLVVEDVDREVRIEAPPVLEAALDQQRRRRAIPVGPDDARNAARRQALRARGAALAEQVEQLRRARLEGRRRSA